MRNVDVGFDRSLKRQVGRCTAGCGADDSEAQSDIEASDLMKHQSNINQSPSGKVSTSQWKPILNQF